MYFYLILIHFKGLLCTLMLVLINNMRKMTLSYLPLIPLVIHLGRACVSCFLGSCTQRTSPWKIPTGQNSRSIQCQLGDVMSYRD